MKLLYITPFIATTGGVERILAERTDYLIKKWNYEINILATNSAVSNTHYDFNKKIKLYSEKAEGKGLFYLYNHGKLIKKYIDKIKPDLVIICDNGVKGYLTPLLVSTKNNKFIFECHVTRFDNEIKPSVCDKIVNYFKFKLFDYSLKKFLQVVIYSNSFKTEIKTKNTIVIPNCLWFSTQKKTDYSSKKVIAVGRHSYKKGYDSMLTIWKKTLIEHPDWILEIYGEKDSNYNLEEWIIKNQLQNNVFLFDPVKNIIDKFLEASLLIFTSKFEGFGMVLIEAMACGLPCISFDCKHGPKDIISDTEDGFLIEPENIEQFVEKLNLTLGSEELRKQMGKKALIKSEKYNQDHIMKYWNELYQSI